MEINDWKLSLHNDFIQRLNNMLDSNYFLSNDMSRAYIIILNNGIPNFIDKINLTEEQYYLVEDTTNLFNDFLDHIEFTKPFGFETKNDIYSNYREFFIRAKIEKHTDLNTENLLVLCQEIVNNDVDKNILSSGIYAVAKSYLHVNKKLSKKDMLRLDELYYCDSRGGIIADRFSFKDIINYVENIGWLTRYIENIV